MQPHAGFYRGDYSCGIRDLNMLDPCSDARILIRGPKLFLNKADHYQSNANERQ